MPKTPPADPSVIVVDRDDAERFEFLRKVFESPQVQVVRDRRKGDRRQAQRPAEEERRAGEERSAGKERRAGDRREMKVADHPAGGFQIHKRRTK